MNVIVMIAASLLPAVVLLLYIWMKDTQKEPTYMLLKAVAWGIGIIILIVFCIKMHKRAYAKVQALGEKDRWIGTDNNC